LFHPFQALFGLFDQLREALAVHLALIELFDDHLSSWLATTYPSAGRDGCAGGRSSLCWRKRLSAARPPGLVDFEQQAALKIVMPISPAVLAEDDLKGLAHLPHIVAGAGIQGILHHGLFGTALASKGGLQPAVWAHPLVDLYQAMRPGQDRNEAVQQLLAGRIAHFLLGNGHVLHDGLKQTDFPQVRAQGSQAGIRRELLLDRFTDNDRLVHSDGPPVQGFGNSPTDRPITPVFWQVLIAQHRATILGEI
jgi:hypothetical protein